MVPSYTLLESRIILGLKVTISCHVSVTVVHVQGNNCDLAGVYHTPSALSPSSLGGLDRNKRSFLQVTSSPDPGNLSFISLNLSVAQSYSPQGRYKSLFLS